MDARKTERAVAAAATTATELGLPVEESVVVHNSDRIAVRLEPCGVLARVAPGSWRDGMAYEVEVALRLAETDAPVGELDPRVEPDVTVRDDFAITLWTYYEPIRAERPAAAAQLGMTTSLRPTEYADALVRFHAGLRKIELDAPHITVRVDEWTALAADRERTPELADHDRALISDTLLRMTAMIKDHSGDDQLLHGEPHPGNLLDTVVGPLFIDVGTCQRGPIEYDLAYVPDEVVPHYPGADPDLVHQFRILMSAGVAAMRWNRDDQYPNRDYWRTEMISQLRASLDRR